MASDATCPHPKAAADGRPYVAHRDQGEATVWYPSPPHHGDVLYCGGVAVGSIHGNIRGAGTSDDPRGCMMFNASADLPPALAAYHATLRRPANLPAG